jgi:Domain of unknown function (DUF5658)
MTDAMGWDPECASPPRRAEEGYAVCRGGRRTRPGAHAYWLLLLLFIELQIADIVTTNHALAIPGIWEANPLMALSQAKLGAMWWLPKLAVAAYLCVAGSLMRRRWPMIFAVSASALAVLGNLAQF